MDSDADDPLHVYLRELSAIQPLAPGEEADLLRRIRGPRDNRSEAAARRLVETHLSLVVSIAEKHSSAGIPTLHLLQEGTCGLMYAVDNFAANFTTPFSDYASACIERAISQAVAQSRSPQTKDHEPTTGN